MRLLSITLLCLLALIQYPLWIGKGSWLRVFELDRLLAIQRQTNHRVELRNQALEGEVRDLQQGLQAIEERARYELGMVKANELFVQINSIRREPAPPVRRDGLGLSGDNAPAPVVARLGQR